MLVTGCAAPRLGSSAESFLNGTEWNVTAVSGGAQTNGFLKNVRGGQLQTPL